MRVFNFYFRSYGLLVLLPGMLLACNPPISPRPEYSPPGEWRHGDENLIPDKVVRDASTRYGGTSSLQKESSRPAPQIKQQTRSTASVPALKRPPKGPPVALLEKLALEGVPIKDSATLSEKLVGALKTQDVVQVQHSLDEASDKSGARPDLASKGVTYLIKGQARISEKPREVKVFLHAIDTQSGKIIAFVSGKSRELESAAEHAGKRMAKKLEEVK